MSRPRNAAARTAIARKRAPRKAQATEESVAAAAPRAQAQRDLISLRIERPWLLRERVVDTLRAAIRRGQFAPGERLTERKLGELVGVSRTVIREALRQLEADGLIENPPYRGPTIAAFSREKIIEIYDVRNALESHAAQLFTERATEKELRALQSVLDELARLRPEDGSEPYLALIERFYAVLLAGSRNTLLESMHSSIRERALVMRSAVTRHALHLADTVAEKRLIVDAITARDAARARSASADHIAAALKRVLAAFAGGA